MDVGAFYPNLALPLEMYPSRREQAENRELIRAVKALNRSESLSARTELTYAWDEDLKRPVVHLVDRETGELIRQIPSRELLDMAKALASIRPVRNISAD